MSLIPKLKALYSVFKAGEQVANPAALKKAQLAANAASFFGSIVVLAKVFGYELPVSNDDLVALGATAAFIYSLFNGGATVASSTKIGLRGQPEPEPLPVIIDPQGGTRDVQPEPKAVTYKDAPKFTD